VSSIDLAEKAFVQNVIISLLQRQQLLRKLHMKVTTRMMMTTMNVTMAKLTMTMTMTMAKLTMMRLIVAVAPTERSQRCTRRELFSPFFLSQRWSK